MRRLRIGMAQINTIVGDFAGNVQKILEVIARARSLRGQERNGLPWAVTKLGTGAELNGHFSFRRWFYIRRLFFWWPRYHLWGSSFQY